MMTTMIAVRVSPARIGAVIGRNVGVMRSGPQYWLVLLSGFCEPLLYLLSIGVGVGALVGDLSVDGRTLPYAAFVAPAMLAVSAMNGALAETTINFFFKMKYQKTFDAVLATPVGPMEIALGELGWAMIRGSVYTAAFLVVMTAFGLVAPLWALAAFPATMLVGLAFGAAGMAVSTLIRGWPDFDMMNVTQFALFLFSGTFTPVQDYPAAIQVVVQVTPLYHAVGLVRDLCLGTPGWGSLGHAAYLAVLTAAGLAFAASRLRRKLLV
ncbi:ABC transporter permease [Sphaerisporangium rubeum]|uniref:Transport permease protein n=1 Tax=Sphaerisporangium rubeum TaxID=321317 RepID=A0A7X0IF83_9ACTN|nr:ABC transporter permease [Sphaerisporangium rubeum]MBB6473858.1 lipooligosaccharide transport system permease protein [Sphaerisporangium rubeum]